MNINIKIFHGHDDHNIPLLKKGDLFSYPIHMSHITEFKNNKPRTAQEAYSLIHIDSATYHVSGRVTQIFQDTNRTERIIVICTQESLHLYFIDNCAAGRKKDYVYKCYPGQYVQFKAFLEIYPFYKFHYHMNRYTLPFNCPCLFDIYKVKNIYKTAYLGMQDSFEIIRVVEELDEMYSLLSSSSLNIEEDEISDEFYQWLVTLERQYLNFDYFEDLQKNYDDVIKMPIFGYPGDEDNDPKTGKIIRFL